MSYRRSLFHVDFKPKALPKKRKTIPKKKINRVLDRKEHGTDSTRIYMYNQLKDWISKQNYRGDIYTTKKGTFGVDFDILLNANQNIAFDVIIKSIEDHDERIYFTELFKRRSRMPYYRMERADEKERVLYYIFNIKKKIVKTRQVYFIVPAYIISRMQVEEHKRYITTEDFEKMSAVFTWRESNKPKLKNWFIKQNRRSKYYLTQRKTKQKEKENERRIANELAEKENIERETVRKKQTGRRT